MPSFCATCNKAHATSVCSGCKSTYYCNKDCQRQDWKQHKQMCLKDGPDKKKRRLETLKTDLFTHQEDIQQFDTICKNLQRSKLIIDVQLPSIINKEIAEFACGEIRECDNEDCSSGHEIFLLLSQISHPSLYHQNDLLFDNNAKQHFGKDFCLIYCKQCKDARYHRCSRCDSVSFEHHWHQCYRCTTSICEFCGDECVNPICKKTYCTGGDTNSFTSGCGERFLTDYITCSNCEEQYKCCEECRDRFAELCPECKKEAKRNKKKGKKKNKKRETNVIYNVSDQKKTCTKCQSDPDEDKGRICGSCDVFVCDDHAQKYGRFCRGMCEKYYCNDCVQKGRLNDCVREECEQMVCDACKYKCEDCWDFLMLNGVDDDEIEQVLRNGNWSDYASD